MKAPRKFVANRISNMLLICADFLMVPKWIADHEKFTDRRSEHAL